MVSIRFAMGMIFFLCCFFTSVHVQAAMYMEHVSTPQSTVEAKDEAKQIRIIDDTGYELVLTEPPSRLLALYGAISELVLALDAGYLLVGRTAADVSIEGLQHLPAVGTHMRPNPEIIMSLKPQVVLQFLGRAEAESLGLGLRRLGVPVLLFRLQNFEDMFRVLEKLGVLIGKEEHAANLIMKFKKRLGHIRNVVMYAKRVPTFYEVRYPNLLGAGSLSMAHDIILTAGGSNVISTAERIVRLNEEELLRLNPTAYIIQKGPMNPDPKPLKDRPHYAHLAAFTQNKVLYVQELAFARPGPRAVETAEMLARWLHPTLDFSVSLNDEK